MALLTAAVWLEDNRPLSVFNEAQFVSQIDKIISYEKRVLERAIGATFDTLNEDQEEDFNAFLDELIWSRLRYPAYRQSDIPRYKDGILNRASDVLGDGTRI